MAKYDTRCAECSTEKEVSLPYADVEKQVCECGGAIKIIITQVNLSVDATPTRGWGKFSDAPKLVKNDGKEFNPGHEAPNASHLRLNQDQVTRLGL